MTEAFSSTVPDCEIVTSRVVNAPIQHVFQVWANPKHLQNWWGPAGFTNTFYEFDFREGGKWHFIMHGPDRGNYANECIFVKIEPPFLIVWERLTKPLFRVVVPFQDVTSDSTKIVFRQVFDTVDACNKIKTFAGNKNEEVFDRLEKELKSVF